MPSVPSHRLGLPLTAERAASALRAACAQTRKQLIEQSTPDVLARTLFAASGLTDAQALSEDEARWLAGTLAELSHSQREALLADPAVADLDVLLAQAPTRGDILDALAFWHERRRTLRWRERAARREAAAALTRWEHVADARGVPVFYRPGAEDLNLYEALDPRLRPKLRDPEPLSRAAHPSRPTASAPRPAILAAPPKAEVPAGPFWLTRTEWHLLRLRHGLDGHTPRTLEETGEALGLTRDRVREMETAIRARIEQYLRAAAAGTEREAALDELLLAAGRARGVHAGGRLHSGSVHGLLATADLSAEHARYLTA